MGNGAPSSGGNGGNGGNGSSAGAGDTDSERKRANDIDKALQADINEVWTPAIVACAR